MFRSIRNGVRSIIRRTGWEVVKRSIWENLLFGIPTDHEARHTETFLKVKGYTMTNSERVVALCNAIDYLTVNNIEGDIVECGIWKGGSTMAAIDTMLYHKSTYRNIYLYDTFEGMPAPSEHDIKKGGHHGAGMSAKELYDNSKPDDVIWCISTLDEVKQNIEKFNYPAEKIHYVKGMVEDTIPKTIPKKIALLRLDTNFYESTKHELEYLFPLLVSGGVLILNDYGEWAGARKAIDEYIKANKVKILLNRIDGTGRVGIKL